MNGSQRGAPRTWLAVMGLSNTLGSEPLVGWQWYCRLKARGDVTVITSETFNRPKFLPASCLEDMVFIDTRAVDEADFANHHYRHLWRWWLGVRSHLKSHAAPGDRLLITAPAPIWMLPWLGGLPIRRSRAFFGPLGADWVPRAIRGRRWPGRRNLRTAAAVLMWRILALGLPQQLALRAPLPGLARAIGGQFDILATLPEIEPPPLAMATGAGDQRLVALLHDTRPRKRFAESFAYAVDRAAATGRSLAVVAVPEASRPGLAAAAARAGVAIEFPLRMVRDDFVGWLAADVAELVSLSSSEGLPSTLIEALLAGCRLHVHDIGGLHWLIACGTDRQDRDWHGAPVVNFRWTDESRQRFAEHSRAGFDALVDRLLAPDQEPAR